MFIGAHIAIGLVIGKVTGNYPAALLGALVIDIDHVFVYIKHGVLFNIEKLWKTITDPEDPYGNQRNYLHSFFTWLAVTVFLLLAYSPFGVAFSLGYLSHLLLDMLDTSIFYPFYPLKFHLKGLVRYLSRTEIVVTIILFLVFLLLEFFEYSLTLCRNCIISILGI